jgi:hypothetical protein
MAALVERAMAPHQTSDGNKTANGAITARAAFVRMGDWLQLQPSLLSFYSLLQSVFPLISDDELAMSEFGEFDDLVLGMCCSFLLWLITTHRVRMTWQEAYYRIAQRA